MFPALGKIAVNMSITEVIYIKCDSGMIKDCDRPLSGDMTNHFATTMYS